MEINERMYYNESKVKCMRIKQQKYNMRKLILLIVKTVPFQVVFIMLHMLFNAFLPAFQTLATADFINAVIAVFEGKEARLAAHISLILILCCILYEKIMPALRNLVEVSAKNHMDITLKEAVTRKRSSLEYQHIENKDTCDLIGRVCENPSGDFWDSFMNLLRGVGLMIECVSLLLIVIESAPISGILILAACIPLFYFSLKMGRKNYEMEKSAAEIKRKYQYFAEVLTNQECAEERTLFSYGKSLCSRYDKLFDDAYKIESKIEKKRYLNMKSGSMFTIVIAMVILLILLPSVKSGKMNLGIYIALVGTILGLVQTMSWQLSEVMYGYAVTKEYLKDFTEFAMLSEKEGACDPPCENGKMELELLEFRNVSFKYPGTEHEILKNCSFVMEGNKSYAFVGVNGAGKTTIIKLLTGLYDEYSGEILINHKNIKEFSYAELKAMIAVVFQDYAKYALSIRENVSLGKGEHISDAKETDVEKALQKAGLGESVERLKEGIDTRLGKIDKAGVDISGGQWQKLAIARMMYADRPIHILDEPTAALDPVAEAKVYELFSRVNVGKFVIYITHRLGAAKMADEILVLNEGYIAEQGDHETLLMNQCGLYSSMYHSQKNWYMQEE